MTAVDFRSFLRLVESLWHHFWAVLYTCRLCLWLYCFALNVRYVWRSLKRRIYCSFMSLRVRHSLDELVYGTLHFWGLWRQHSVGSIIAYFENLFWLHRSYAQCILMRCQSLGLLFFVMLNSVLLATAENNGRLGPCTYLCRAVEDLDLVLVLD